MDSVRGDERVREIQARSKAERDLTSQVSGQVTSRYLKGELEIAVRWLDDVDGIFLGRALEEARNADALSRWLGYAEFALERAVLKRKQIQSVIAKYGPDAAAVG